MDIPSLLTGIAGSAGIVALFGFLSERSKSRASAQIETIKTAPAVTLAQIAAESAESTNRHQVIQKRIEQDGETERQEITSTVDITRLAFEQANSSRLFSDGIVKLLQQCEERSAKATRDQVELDRKREEEHGKVLTDLTSRYEGIITDIRRASDDRDRKTREEIQPFLNNYSAIEETFKNLVRDHSETEETLRTVSKAYADYRERHPSDPNLQAQKPPPHTA